MSKSGMLSVLAASGLLWASDGISVPKSSLDQDVFKNISEASSLYIEATIHATQGPKEFHIFIISEMEARNLRTRVYKDALEDGNKKWLSTYLATEGKITEFRAHWNLGTSTFFDLGQFSLNGSRMQLEKPMLEFPKQAQLHDVIASFRLVDKQLAEDASLSYKSIKLPQFDMEGNVQSWTVFSTPGTVSGFLSDDYDCLTGSYLATWIGNVPNAHFFRRVVQDALSDSDVPRSLLLAHKDFSRFATGKIAYADSGFYVLRQLNDERVDTFLFDSKTFLPKSWFTYERVDPNDSFDLTRKRTYRIEKNKPFDARTTWRFEFPAR